MGGHTLNLNDSPVPRPNQTPILRADVLPLDGDFRRTARKSRATTGADTLLIYGDTHFPHQDDAALAVVMAIAEDVQPDHIIHVGDGIDAADLSLKFKPNPERRNTLQAEIDAFRQHLAAMRLVCPNADFTLLEGNHEERLTRLLWSMEGPAAVLMELTASKRALTWPALLGLDQLRIKWVPYGDQPDHEPLPGLKVKHGSVVRQQAGYTATAEWRRQGVNGASGHTHRLALVHVTDARGTWWWAETGCTCLTRPSYTALPDWQQGCVLVTRDRATGLMSAEPIRIQKGTAFVRGRLYHP